MKVLVFSWYTLYSSLRFELEMMQQHLDDGDDVTQLYCDSRIQTCEVNPGHRKALCRSCLRTKDRGLACLSSPIESLPFLNLTRADELEAAACKVSFDSLEELTAFQVEDFDLGWGVLSSIITMTRDPKPDLSAHRKLVKDLTLSALTAYRSIQNHLDQNAFDRVYVFNGRLAVRRAVLRACQSRGVPCYIVEQGHDMHHYALYKNTSRYDRAYVEAEIHRDWEQADPVERVALAEKYYVDRTKGIPQAWHSFVGGQQDGLLPADWRADRRNMVIFNSSEDEFVSIGQDWRNPLYDTQLQGLQRIVESLRTWQEPFHLYLRVHPNLKGVENEETRALYALQADFLTVIPPDDPVSTYTLIRHAEKVLSFGSTVGIEAVFFGKPSILAGISFYRDLGGTYNPADHEALVSLLKADLEPGDREAALRYGHYMQTFGIRCRYYEPITVVDGTFKGVVLHEALPPPPVGERMKALLPGSTRRFLGRLRRRWFPASRSGSR